MKYEHLIQLMSYWQEFEEAEQSQDIKRFAVWLSRHTNRAAEPNNQITEPRSSSAELKPARDRLLKNLSVADAERVGANNQITFPDEATRDDVMHYYRHLPLNSRISALLTRMNRFASFYTKKAFYGLEITNAQEFGILACVQGLGTPTKTEVAHFNLLEKTTGTEMMKRLIKLGFLEEFDDENDKRSKRVKITPQGNSVMETAVQQLWELSEIVVGNLSDDQKHQLVFMLEELNDFHSNIYFNDSTLPLGEIIAKNVLQT
ncbi:MAG: MarR family transcriptional regulator [Ignavibacteria bacterium]|nr:MarR family transcriptional regulator [Ignavibacteria bacterium]